MGHDSDVGVMPDYPGPQAPRHREADHLREETDLGQTSTGGSRAGRRCRTKRGRSQQAGVRMRRKERRKARYQQVLRVGRPGLRA